MTYRKRPDSSVSLDDLLEGARFVLSVDPTGAIVGGVAMGLYGSKRMTTDVDVVYVRAPRMALKRGRALTFGGFTTRTPNGVTLDVIVRDDKYKKLYAHAAARAVKVQGLRVARIDYLAAMKLSSGRDKDEDDLRTLVALYPGWVSRMTATIRRELGAYAEDDFVQLALEVKLMGRDGRRRRR